MNDKAPQYIMQSFPQLEDAHFLRRLASPVPLVPDTTFDIYVNDSREYFVLVTTDHIDTEGQYEELLSISGSNEFKMMTIVKPFKIDGDAIELTGIDISDDKWFVKNKEGSAHSTYFYLASIESKPQVVSN